MYYRINNDSSWKPVPGSYKAPSSISATGYEPEYATVSWVLPEGVKLLSSFYQHQDRALKFSRYYFKFSQDSNIQDIYVTVNGNPLTSDEYGWYEIEYVDQDEYIIKVYDAVHVDEIAENEDSGIVEVFTIDGIRVQTLLGNFNLDSKLNKLPSGIYIVKKGAAVKKVIVGH